MADDLWERLGAAWRTSPERGLQVLLIEFVAELYGAQRRRGMELSDVAKAAGLPESVIKDLLPDPSTATVGTLVRLANAVGCRVVLRLAPADADEETIARER